MSDPYNTATPPSRANDDAPGTPTPNLPPRPRTPARPAKAITLSERTALLPVVNVVALLVIVGQGFKSSMSLGGLVFGCGPFLLAMATSLWVSNPTFTTTVRWANAAFAAFALIKLLRYASLGIFNGGMVVVFVLAVLLPAFNALYLRPASR